MLRIGFIGCGNIARHHATRLVTLRNTRIVAASDLSAKVAAAFARDYDISFHTGDNGELLRRDDVDAVFVCTPTSEHPKPVIQAAKAGKHIFCEKPMALNTAAARRMAAACEKAGVHLTLGFVRRFDTQWGKLKQIVQSGAVGRPVIWRFSADGRPQRAWFRDVNQGGGPLMDGAVHNYDFAMQVFGPVESVQAASLQFDSTSVGADTGSAILSFASGDQHALIWSWGTAPGAQVASLNDVIGPKGSLQFGMTATASPASFDPGKQGAFTLKKAGGKEKVYAYRKQDMFLEQLKHVVRALDHGEQPLVTATDGIAAVEVAAAVLKSGISRRTIKL
ncbi:MAG: Gfo/Idh/MocA family oxidoreductase [Thermoplasmatota archaeon]